MSKVFIFPGQGSQFPGMGKIYLIGLRKQKNYFITLTKF